MPDIIINLEACNHKTPKADTALEVLKYISLAFSSLFMLELLASIWAFGKSCVLISFLPSPVRLLLCFSCVHTNRAQLLRLKIPYL